MKKVLFISNVLSHIEVFHRPYIDWLQQQGCEVHVMTNAGGKLAPFCDKLYDIGIERSPFNLKNVSIIRQAKIIIEKEQYDIIHCHTPMGGVVGRLASCTMRKHGTKVLYTAHGFHFYKGAPAVNWLLYYTMERLLAGMTDCLITINNEDYFRVKEKFHNKKLEIYKIDGIGVDVSRFSEPTKKEKAILKEKNGFTDKLLLIYTAEFIPRKNHRFFIDALPLLIETQPNIHILFAGKGVLMSTIEEAVKEKGLEKYVSFLGFCQNMPELYKMADIVVSASIEEGFGINLVEGMASGLPAVASVVRGHKEMVYSGKNGYLFDTKKPEEFCEKVHWLCKDIDIYRSFSQNAVETAKNFSVEHSLEQMSAIYQKYMN